MPPKINPVKIKQEADKLEKAGRLDQSIALYRQLVEDNPRDWNTVKKIGDLYVRLNRNREAVVEYEKLAEFYAKDGFLLKAIAIWKQINKLDGTALEPYQHLAELYAKQGLMMEAKGQYQIVVDEYIKRGRAREAGDVLRKMAEIDPGDLKIRSKLADLYIRDGDTPRAVEEHVAIAEELNKKGHLAEALQVLEKGLKLDPRSNRLRSELGRVHLIQKNFDKAAHFLEEAVQLSPQDVSLLGRLGEAYLGAKRIEEAEAIFRRLLELNPDDEDSRTQMGRVYLMQDRYDEAYSQLVGAVDRLLARRDADKAAALLQQVVQRNPGHVKTLVKLVEVYDSGHKVHAATSALSQLTEAYIQQGHLAEAVSALENLSTREPGNQQHRSKLDMVRARLAGGGRAAPPRAPTPPAASPSMSFSFEEEDILEEEFDLEPEPSPSRGRSTASASPPSSRAAAAPSAPPPRPSPAVRPSVVASGPHTEEDREFIEEHLAEGRVFRKYGLVDKATDQFEAVLARFPDNVEARQELREVLKEKGAFARAAEQCLALAEIYRQRGDEAAASREEEEAQRLEPVAPPTPVSGIPVFDATGPALEPDGEEVVTFEEEPAFTPVHEEEEISLDMEEPSFATPAAPIPSRRAAAPPARPAEELSIDLGDSEEDLPGGLFVEEEPEAPLPFAPAPSFEPTPVFEAAAFEPTPAFEIAPEEPVFAAPLVAEAAEEEQDISFPLDVEQELALQAPEPVRAPPPPAPAARPARTAAPPAPAVSSATAAIQRVLEEVDQYMSLGFVDDARDALREIRARHADHPAIRAKVAELGLDLEGAEEAVFAAGSEIDVVIETEEEAPAPPPVARVAPEPVRSHDPFDDLGLEEPVAAPEAPEPLAGLEEPFEPDALLADAVAAAAAERAYGSSSFGNLGSGEVDLISELGDLFGTQSAVEEPPASAGTTELGDAGLADIFKEFRKGVDKQLGQEDYDTRYNLGIAYKEMGLLDEAIAEFQLAAKDAGRLLECSSMLGICFLEKGMPKLAIKWFEKGLRVPGRKDEEYQGLRYDLAAAHEAAGDADMALNLYTELYGQDANFRDVAAKVRELSGP